jgi:hypothetical protein
MRKDSKKYYLQTKPNKQSVILVFSTFLSAHFGNIKIIFTGLSLASRRTFRRTFLGFRSARVEVDLQISRQILVAVFFQGARRNLYRLPTTLQKAKRQISSGVRVC